VSVCCVCGSQPQQFERGAAIAAASHTYIHALTMHVHMLRVRRCMPPLCRRIMCCFEDSSLSACFCFLPAVSLPLPRDRACIHSWDICNEPRNKLPVPADQQPAGTPHDAPDAPNNELVAKWVDDAAGFVKRLDSKHPVTVGSEGFFEPRSFPTGKRPPATPCEWSAIF
jgi:hypothetical protein